MTHSVGDRGSHTQGPWTIAYRDDLAFRFGTEDAWEVMGETHGVAIVPGSEANARLIAAAPALLDFAKALDASWTEAFPEGPDGEHRDRIIQMADEHRALWRQCRAAIQSATGEG